MNTITPSKEQSKRSAADIYAAFEYQWNYFVFTLLNEIDDTSTVSFELHDDVDTQTGEVITFYQIKHSVQNNASGKTINLSDRDSDLWKTLSNWMKFIDDQPEILPNASFILVTNKNISDNKFVKALTDYQNSHNLDDFKSTIEEIKNSEKKNADKLKDKPEESKDEPKTKRIDVSKIISDLLSYPNLDVFCGRITFSKTEDILKEAIKKRMKNRFGLNEHRIDWVYGQIMTSLKDDAIERIENRKPVSYTGGVFTEKYQSILDIGRKKIHFRSDYFITDFKGEPNDLLFMKQLFEIGDTDKKDIDRVTELTVCWLRFNNNFHEHWNNNVLTQDDVNKLTQNVYSRWRTYHRSKHRLLPQNCTEKDLCNAGCETVDEMRKEQFSLAGTNLEQSDSEGCIYYYSNSSTDVVPELPLIGWHRDWESKFKKS